MGPPKSRESQFREFWDYNLGVPRQNDFWVLAPWPDTKKTVKEKVVASPKSRPWWVLWIHFCPWLVRAPKVFQLCINQLVVWFVHVNVNNWHACHCHNPHPGAPTHLSTFEVLRAREHTPTLYPSTIFTFGITIESIKEFEGASLNLEKKCWKTSLRRRLVHK
jgi:hypothetical protein